MENIVTPMEPVRTLKERSVEERELKRKEMVSPTVMSFVDEVFSISTISSS